MLHSATEPLSQAMIKSFHSILKAGTSDSRKDWFAVGDYKKLPNEVGGNATSLPENVEQEMTALLVDYHQKQTKTFRDLVDFHWRFETIHPFQDGNGRIARLLVNFILLRKRYPMIVVRSSDKHTYLNALSAADAQVGTFPSDGANATLEQIKPFTVYMEKQLFGELMQNIAFVEGSADRIWLYNGRLISFRSPRTPRLLHILADNPRVTNAELSSQLGINTSAVQKQLTTLSKKGYIVKDSNPKRWRVIALPTTSKGGTINEGGQTNTEEE